MKKLTQAEYDAALVLHEKWLNDEKGGVRMTFVKFDFSDIDFGESANLQSADLQWANLRSADLRSADLRWANLQWADLQWANLRSADLQWANLRSANLQWADLQWANLQWANLRSANLQWADLDFSAFPLWCGGTKFTVDARIFAQIVAHLCTLIVDDPACIAAQQYLRPLAETSHHAKILPDVVSDSAPGKAAETRIPAG